MSEKGVDLNPTRRIRDPHHGGNSEWCLHLNSFYIRCQTQTKWHLVRRIKLTPKRVLALHTLLER